MNTTNLSSTTSNIALKQIINNLKSKSEPIRNKAAKELRELVEKTSREKSGEGFSQFIDTLNSNIQELIASRESNERIGAIIAIDKLIDVNYDDSRKIAKFSNNLRNALTNQHSDPITVQAVSKVLGRLAKASSSSTSKTLTAEWVEFEIKRALEWLEGDGKHKDEGRRFAAVLVLKELADNAPTLFYAHVQTFLNHIWAGLRDPSPHVREASASALGSVLGLISERRSLVRVEWYHDIFGHVLNGFKLKGNLDSVHGSLLVMTELLRNTGNFMMEQYDEVCNDVLKYIESKDKFIRKSCMQMMPIVAKFYKQKFIEGPYLGKMITFLITILKNPQTEKVERAAGFISLGELCLEVGPQIIAFEDQILSTIKENLLVKKTKSLFIPEALECLKLFVRVVGEKVSDKVSKILPPIFASGLSSTLTDALKEISEKIPSLQSQIQQQFLSMIYTILAQSAFSPVNSKSSVNYISGIGSLTNTANTTTLPQSLSSNTLSALPAQTPEANEQIVTLALKTLATLNIRSHNMIDFVHDCIMNYLDDERSSIRKEAAKSCCKLLVSQGRPPVKGHYGMVVGTVLEKLLTVGITDQDSAIRHAVLSSLSQNFDHFLALSDNLKYLFIALNDEVFKIRVISISIIGRLSIKNPAFVLPSLRKTLIQLLTELEFSEDTRNKEESATMLGHLIDAAPKLIKPYVPSIVKVLMKKITDPNPTVSSSVLDTTGKLAVVGESEMMQFMNDLLPLVLDTLHDQSSTTKRAIAVRTLGKIIQSTGYVITPYVKYPKLLGTLLTILKTEEEWITRREVIKVLGIIGAIDPYRYGNLQLQNDVPISSMGQASLIDSSDIYPSNISPSSDEYYPTVAFGALMKILTDNSLSMHHTAVIQAVMFIFTSLGMKCVSFLPQIVPPFLNLIRTCDSSMKNSLFQQLSVLVSIVKQHIRNYLDDIFLLIQDFWKSDYKSQIITLEEEICIALNEEFKPYLSIIIPQLLGVLQGEKNRPQVAIKVLHALVIFGKYLEDYLYLIIPAVVRLFEVTDSTEDLKVNALKTISRLSKLLSFSEYSSRIIHPLLRILGANVPEVTGPAMVTLCAVAYQLGSDFAVFIPLVTKQLTTFGIKNAKYEDIVEKIMKNLPIPENLSYQDEDEEDSYKLHEDGALSEVKKMPVNQANLRKAWEASQRATKEDWIEWIRGFSVELLRESPSPALRSCSPLAQIYHPLARDLFNAGFVSCWTELDDKAQSEVVRALEIAFSSPNLPPEVLQTLLNLAEYMEHDEKPLPIDISALGLLAEKCQAYAKALHYKESEFHINPSQLIEGLISINNQLQQHEAAMGILKYAQRNHSIELKESWYEKLQRWEEAYEVYEVKQKQNPYSLSLTLGRMRCLKALGEWEKLFDLCQDAWNHANQDTKPEIALMGAAASWNLAKWDFMKDCVNLLEETSSEGTFYRAILCIHDSQFDKAQQFIDQTRQILDRELAALVGESYNRAYDIIVRVQQLSEMEEIVQYKKLNQSEDFNKQYTIRTIWVDRLGGIKRNVEHWQNILSIRKLVVPIEEDIDTWLKFASLCRKSNKIQMSQKILLKLLNNNEVLANPSILPSLHDVNPKVVFEYLKHMWSLKGKQQQTFELLNKFVRKNEDLQNDTNLLAKCFLTLGKWQQSQYLERSDSKLIEETQILENLKLATEFGKESYKAWHAFALMNTKVVGRYETEEQEANPNNMNQQTHIQKQLSLHLVAAVHGYFKSISYSFNSNSGLYGKNLQDVLRLLTLWFKHGARSEVEKTLMEGFNTVSIDTWLQVIPQLIARINSHITPIRKLVHELLSKVGKAHPQALIYPLTVNSKSQAQTRRSAADNLLNQMRTHSNRLVDQALMVSQELIRVAILWNEMWHEGLEEASRLYFGENDIEGMFNTLAPLHKMLKRPDTLSEMSFTQQFGRDLQEALEWCRKYKRTSNKNDLTQAWDLYYNVFRKINKQLQQMITFKLELQFVSPKLLEANRIELAVPGTYKPDQTSNIVRISHFAKQLKVINSKQRPRKLKMFGSDGNKYQFLLKGHEDLRQDERVMQLFGLVNTLLYNDSETSTRDLSIKRYAVIPLSANAGLIEWVDNCDTLHSLIKEYRESRNILLNLEHRMMLQMAPDYDNLTLMQKIEVFDTALENTTGQDLYKVLWLKSRSSEVWLYRRTNYTRSLAVMSMVGYILGLGDRHPSNLMLEKLTGKIVHIDFGDCFEVAMHREKFPEKIPFRLTRMLVNAMEVCGIEGTFRSTCESVMRVLRDNKDSVMAMLEAFVHDPLINWRLLEAQNSDANLNAQGGNSPAMHPPQGNSSGLKSDSTTFETMSSSVHGNNWSHGSRSIREKELKKTLKSDHDDNLEEIQPGALNKRALSVISRISNKLTGKDFDDTEDSLDIPNQVQRLIQQATSHANLCQCYIGWCAFW